MNNSPNRAIAVFYGFIIEVEIKRTVLAIAVKLCWFFNSHIFFSGLKNAIKVFEKRLSFKLRIRLTKCFTNDGSILVPGAKHQFISNDDTDLGPYVQGHKNRSFF